MTQLDTSRGGAPVGYITQLDAIGAASMIYLRLWSDGPDGQTQVRNDFATGLGPDTGHKAVQAFEHLFTLCARHGRRPLMRHSIACKCLGADEACFANFIATAAQGEREDALLIATLLVRVDMAPLIAAYATDFGLALMRMNLSAPHTSARHPIQPAILH